MAIGKAIQSLVAGEQVAGSKIGGKLLEELLSEGLLVVVARGSRKAYRARDTERLKRFLTDRDESYRMLEVENAETRAAMANKTGNSKLVAVRSCPGFPINSYEPITCLLNGESFVVNPHEGSFLFVTQWESFKIPADVIVIGIENMENFRLIRKQKKFFENYLHAHALPNKTLFVSRYPQSNDLRKWLTTIPNRYLHFGDFDLAGIHIFLTEFERHIGTARASFLIPSDIATRLKSGSSQRYDEQHALFKEMQADVPELGQLITLIHQERKGYDQEGYINRCLAE